MYYPIVCEYNFIDLRKIKLNISELNIIAIYRDHFNSSHQ